VPSARMLSKMQSPATDALMTVEILIGVRPFVNVRSEYFSNH
jgi:hypothetical protein